MKFHGMDMKGSFKCQSVVDASALVWDASDESRVVYDVATELIWVANNSDWATVGNYSDFPAGTEMWFYQSAEPDGWSISATGDALLAVKSSTGTYDEGGTVGGNPTWATPAHSHNLMSHVHTFSGSTGGPDVTNQGGKGDAVKWLSKNDHTHVVSGTANTSGTNYTSIDGSVTDFRPQSSVGLICSKD